MNVLPRHILVPLCIALAGLFSMATAQTEAPPTFDLEIEGGADVDEVYSFAWLHYAVTSLRYSF